MNRIMNLPCLLSAPLTSGIGVSFFCFRRLFDNFVNGIKEANYPPLPEGREVINVGAVGAVRWHPLSLLMPL